MSRSCELLAGGDHVELERIDPDGALEALACGPFDLGVVVVGRRKASRRGSSCSATWPPTRRCASGR